MWTKENLFRGLHESLARVPTDYVDVMQLHNPSVEHPTAGTGQSRDHRAEWDRLAAATRLLIP
jgi:aryl-alcohol dehydrogenase-like predicted oxidoreductase